ncbi:hypothetical protein CYMTET_44884 [Cymbomonas tetramitiformis]|uniref:Uncharacterized protein n=1 Tax=Cymbomonas tetramitiformis TaxID=36881 RepID=A0AAE0C0I5_9CHLO|nr:hypothetical protein CYMTET_44884 [Cymbomonas tetramitiformis]
MEPGEITPKRGGGGSPRRTTVPTIHTLVDAALETADESAALRFRSEGRMAAPNASEAPPSLQPTFADLSPSAATIENPAYSPLRVGMGTTGGAHTLARGAARKLDDYFSPPPQPLGVHIRSGITQEGPSRGCEEPPPAAQGSPGETLVYRRTLSATETWTYTRGESRGRAAPLALDAAFKENTALTVNQLPVIPEAELHLTSAITTTERGAVRRAPAVVGLHNSAMLPERGEINVIYDATREPGEMYTTINREYKADVMPPAGRDCDCKVLICK